MHNVPSICKRAMRASYDDMALPCLDYPFTVRTNYGASRLPAMRDGGGVLGTIFVESTFSWSQPTFCRDKRSNLAPFPVIAPIIDFAHLWSGWCEQSLLVLTLCDTPQITPHRTLSAEMTYPAPGGGRGTGRSRAGCSDSRDIMIRYRLAAQAGKWRWQWYVVAVVCTRVIIESRYGISPAGRQPVCSRGGQGAAILVTSIYIAGSYHRDIRRLRTHGYKSTILRRPCWRSRRPFSGAVELSCDTCNKMYTIIFFFYDSHTG